MAESMFRDSLLLLLVSSTNQMRMFLHDLNLDTKHVAILVTGPLTMKLSAAKWNDGVTLGETISGNKACSDSGHCPNFSKIKSSWLKRQSHHWGTKDNVTTFVNQRKKSFCHFCGCQFNCCQNCPLNFHSNIVVVNGVCFGNKACNYSNHWPNLWWNTVQLTEMMESMLDDTLPL
jgi:hypothetical protein